LGRIPALHDCYKRFLCFEKGDRNMRDWGADIAWCLLAAFVAAALMIVAARFGHAPFY
jgi:hypothetical protein